MAKKIALELDIKSTSVGEATKKTTSFTSELRKLKEQMASGELKGEAFDEAAAKVSGIHTRTINTLLIMLTAITVVISMRVVGLMLASALIILPAATALQLRMNFKKTLLWSAGIGVLAVIVGLFVATIFNFAVSGTIVLCATIAFLATMLITRIKR